jgi:hypothetical protein
MAEHHSFVVKTVPLDESGKEKATECVYVEVNNGYCNHLGRDLD